MKVMYFQSLKAVFPQTKWSTGYLWMMYISGFELWWQQSEALELNQSFSTHDQHIRIDVS